MSLSCPLKDGHRNGDKNPSATIDFETGVFICGKCGNFSPARFLSHLLPELTHQQAGIIVDEYRRDKKLVTKHGSWVTVYSRNPKFDQIYLDAKKGFRKDHVLVTEYCLAKGLSPELLEAHEIGILPSVEQSCFGKKGYPGGPVLVFPYKLNGKVVALRYRDEEGSKGGESGCHFTLWGIDDLQDSTKVAVIVEGETDHLAVEQALEGLDCIVVSAPGAQFRAEWKREFTGIEHVVLIPQADEASVKMIEAAKSSLGDQLHVLPLPWSRRQLGKDACEWLAGSANNGEELRVRIQSLIGHSRRSIMTGTELRMDGTNPENINRRYLVNQMLIRRQTSMIAGQPKSFKTWLVCNLARTVLVPGEDFLGIPGLCTEQEGLKVLFIEEEGDVVSLYDRAAKVFQGVDRWEERTFWGHHLGVKLDEDHWVKRIEECIGDNKIDLAIGDPFARLHSKGENEAEDMSELWDAVHRLTTRFDFLHFLFVHHFRKSGLISDRWNAFRGSSVNAATVDLGMFVERRARSEGVGIKLAIEGRDIAPIENDKGDDVWKCYFNPDTGRLIYDDEGVHVNKYLALLEEVKERREWELKQAAKFFACHTDTIKNWCSRLEDKIMLTKPSGGNPVKLKYIGEL